MRETENGCKIPLARCEKAEYYNAVRFYINNASCDELKIAISLLECVVKGWSMWKRIYSGGKKKTWNWCDLK